MRAQCSIPQRGCYKDSDMVITSVDDQGSGRITREMINVVGGREDGHANRKRGYAQVAYDFKD